MLITIDGVLQTDEARRLRHELDAARWEDGARTAGAVARQAKHNQQVDDGCPVGTALSQQVLRRVAGHPLFISAALPRRLYPPKFNRYAGGGTYGAHVDSAILHLPGGGGSLRSDLSATLFLSEPDEYDGGELEIETPFGVQSVKLPAGDLVLYPSSSLHRVTPVTSGARLASFFWIESLVPHEGDRTLLFDLDQTIQGLGSSLPPGDAHVLKLTGIYHNLLRRHCIT